MSPSRRAIAGAVIAAVYLGAHAAFGRLRPDHGWLAAAAFLAVGLGGGRARSLALFVTPLLLLGAIYDAQRLWADALRAPIHVAEPQAWELAWFGVATDAGIVTPARWCQAHTAPVLDAIAGAAYLLFIPGFIAMAAWWRFGRRRPDAQDVMWAMLWLNLAGYVTYLAYPAAPPWYVDHYGVGPVNAAVPSEAAGAARFDAMFGVTWFAGYYGRNANVFGAIPSLHVGQTFLAALYAWRFRSLRAVALIFWALVTWASVYLNHHYLVDGVVGIAYAVAAWAVMLAWRRAHPLPAWAPAAPAGGGCRERTQVAP